MQLSRSSILEIVKKNVTEEELRDSVVYIIPNLAKGEELTINRNKTVLRSPAFLLFIDLEPRANWSHKCRYLLVGESGEILEKIQGNFPPDETKLQLLLMPQQVEDWNLITAKRYLE
jgi:hypothetical protein